MKGAGVSRRSALGERTRPAAGDAPVRAEHAKVLEALLESVPDLVAHVDVEGRFLFVSRVVPSFGAVRPRAEGLFDMVDPDFHMQLRACLDAVGRGGTPRSQEVVGQGAFGACTHYRLHVSPARELAGFTVIGTDVTERRELEERMRHAQKMDAIGQLTAGIAHNFNNMLTGILPCVELALRDATPRSRSFLENARDAAERAARMVRQLLLFAGAEDQAERRHEDVAEVVERTVQFFRATLERRIGLELSGAPELPRTALHATQLEQAVLNVLINARDALDGLHDRRPRIRVAVQAMGAAELSRFGELAHGRYVVVSVEDNGTGMDEQTRRRIFEPFYTTKEPGRGTGLGLAMVYGVLREHGGFVECESVSGEGTTFFLGVPVVEGAPLVVERERDEPVIADARATLLLVDDEEVVLSAVGTLLRDAGYDVIEARDGQEALHVFERCHSGIDLVLLDQSLPVLSGSAVLAGLLRIDPRVTVVSFSGQATPLPGAVAAVDKPVNSRRLLSTVREVLRARDQSRFDRSAQA
jgi:two-component system cell cycle sensor histidine kinase/response regulator CckA